MTVCMKGSETRVLKDRHGSSCGSPETCPGCLPCREAHCLLCKRAHAEVTCPRCLSVARTNLHDAVRLAGKLSDESLNGQRSSKSKVMPGGDALVLQAPAATSHGYASQLLHRVLFGLDVSHTQEESKGDPTPPLAVLLHWEDRWRAHTGDPTGLAPTMARSADYLDRHMHEMARDVSFPPFAKALAALVRQMEDVLTDGERPERTRVPCWECGTRLVKVYADAVARDHYVCPCCHEEYDQGRFERAKHDHLASTGAERYVFITDAAAAIGRSERSVRTWIGRGVARTSRDARTGRIVVWWPDVRAAHQAAGTRKRRSA